MSEATASAMSVPGADPGPAVRLFLYTGAAGLALFALWAAFSPLDVVSTATGQIIPSSQVQREQPLVVLQATASEADMAELKVRLAALGIELARLEAEATGAAVPAVPPDLAAAYPQIASQARCLFTARRQRVQSQIAAQRETISQRQNELREIQVRLRNAPNSLRMLEEQVRISDDLMRDQLTSRLQHLSLTREAKTTSAAGSRKTRRHRPAPRPLSTRRAPPSTASKRSTRRRSAPPSMRRAASTRRSPSASASCRTTSCARHCARRSTGWSRWCT